MAKERVRAGKQLRKEITSKLLESEGMVPELSRLHGISRSTLYKWVSKARKEGRTTSQSSGGKEFVELLVKEASNDLKGSGLQKAWLTFGNFSLFIEGEVSSSKIV